MKTSLKAIASASVTGARRQWKINLAALLLITGAVMSGAPDAAESKMYPDVQIIGSTDKSPLSYKPEEHPLGPGEQSCFRSERVRCGRLVHHEEMTGADRRF